MFEVKSNVSFVLCFDIKRQKSSMCTYLFMAKALWVSVGFLTCLSAETAFTRVAAIVGVNVLITSGEETDFRENACLCESYLRVLLGLVYAKVASW